MTIEDARNALLNLGMTDAQVSEIESSFVCEDAVSRQAVLNLILYYYGPNEASLDDIANLSAVIPVRPRGRWIKVDPYPLQQYDYQCSECAHGTNDVLMNFCPECGTEMFFE